MGPVRVVRGEMERLARPVGSRLGRGVRPLIEQPPPGRLDVGGRRGSRHPAWPRAVQNIFRAMQTYGLIVADNGSDLYVTGAMDARWNNSELNPAFGSLTAADFDVIRLGWR